MLHIHAVYIHIPFCTHLCSYCDFAKQLPVDNWSGYIHAISNELSILKKRFDFQLTPTTLYFGGGTPSLFEGALVSKITSALKAELDFDQLNEFTVEANPSDISNSLLDNFKDLGVTRLSIGIQSSFSGLLLNMGRVQQETEVLHAFKILQPYKFPINLDLIYAVPGMNLNHLTHSLQALLDQSPSHISPYELTLHPTHATYPYKPNDEDILEQAALIQSTLKQHSYNHYEVSNYAKPTFESQHNLHYWNGKNILGLGVSAHSSLYFQDPSSDHWTNVNWTNPGSLNRYQELTDNLHPANQAKKQSPTDTEKLYLISHLRKTTGLSLQDYKSLFKKEFKAFYKAPLEDLREHNLVRFTQSHCISTSQGLNLLDSILATLFEVFDS